MSKLIQEKLTELEITDDMHDDFPLDLSAGDVRKAFKEIALATLESVKLEKKEDHPKEARWDHSAYSYNQAVNDLEQLKSKLKEV